MIDVSNDFTIENYEFLDEEDEFEIKVENVDDIELLTYFYDCIRNFIFEKDFDTFLVCLHTKIGTDKVQYVLSNLVDINDPRMKSFLNLVDNQYPNFQFEYIHLPTTLERVSSFILDKLKLKLGLL